VIDCPDRLFKLHASCIMFRSISDLVLVYSAFSYVKNPLPYVNGSGNITKVRHGTRQDDRA